MLLPRSHMQERLCEAYVSAVVARAGLKIVGLFQREYGVDAYIQGFKQLLNGETTESGPILECQLKSTTTSTMRNGKIIYDMEVNAYNKLVSVDGRILLLYCMPDNINHWLEVNEEKLVLKTCCYWDYIAGDWSNNRSKKRIFVPNNQLFTPESAIELMRKLRLGEFSRENTAD